MIKPEEFVRPAELLIDTGAEPNIIKKSLISNIDQIDEERSIRIIGISSGEIITLGSINISVLDHDVEFHIINDDSTLKFDGIFGTDALRENSQIDLISQNLHWHNLTIPFANSEKIELPARSRKIGYIKILNPETRIGYIPLLNLRKGIFVGNAAVSIENNKAYLEWINTTDEIITLSIPEVKVQDMQVLDEIPVEKVINCLNIKESIDRVTEIKNQLDSKHLNHEEIREVDDIIKSHHDLFHLLGENLHCTNAIEHTITLTDSIPVHTRQYRYPPIHREEIMRQVNELLDNKIIASSVSPYNSPLWIVPKKPDSDGNKRWRLVVDFRALNKKTVGNAFPLPNITEILDQLGKAQYFTVLDLASGFHQIPMRPEDAPKTAFSTPDGHYEWLRMPFGLENAPRTFQALMNKIMTGLQGLDMFVYMDDIIIFAATLNEHRIKFDRVANRLREANLQLQPDKCKFLSKEVVYLGHVISRDGVRPNPDKIRAVSEFPVPKTAKNVKQFLGLAGYYRRFIQNFASMSKPLTLLLKKGAKFEWNLPQQKALDALKNVLCKQPILQYPDYSKTFILTTDASGYAIGGILSQETMDCDLPIAYGSRTLNKAELNYTTTEKELLAIIYFVRYFRPYLYGQKFILRTDHKPLIWLNNVKDPTSRLLRWRIKLADYDYKIEYKAGTRNTNADALSRNPVPVLPIIVDDSSDDESSLGNESDSDSSDDDEDGHTLERTDTLINSPEEENLLLIQETRDQLIMSNNDKLIFVTEDGNPGDIGALNLQKYNQLPPLSKKSAGHIETNKKGRHYIISLYIKSDAAQKIQEEILEEGLRRLVDLIKERKLKILSISKGPVGDIDWPRVLSLIKDIFQNISITIQICNGMVIIPTDENKERIIEEGHCSAMGGHKGITKTYRRIRNNYYWSGIKKDIKSYISTCRKCQIKRLVRIKPRQPMIITDTPGAGFDKVALDVMGPLPITNKGNRYILTIQDLLTKFSVAIPLSQVTAIDIADAFTKQFICLFGAPRAILTDRGTNFVNSLMKNLARKFRLKHYRTTSFHPQSNGSLERSHHVLMEYLKQTVKKNTEWDDCVELAIYSYNTSVHEGTQYTPYELIFAKNALLPASDPPIPDGTCDTYAEYLINLYEKMRNIQEMAKTNLIKSKMHSKELFDKRARPQTLTIGDVVYLLKEPKKGKMDDEYSGPYTIEEIFDNHNIKIRINHRKTKVVHIDKLKKAL